MTSTTKPNMKRLLSRGAVPLFVTMTMFPSSTAPGTQDRADNERVRGRFIGVWRLAWLEEPDANGKVRKADGTGMLVYTRDAHMSVQVMYRIVQPGSNAAPVQYTQGVYEASFGTYEIEERTRSFSFHVEGALVRTLLGKDLRRVFEFSGNQLIV